jgi:outer membrane lipoprotein-sorting protein
MDLLDMDNIANNPLLRIICSALFVIAAIAAHSGEIVEPNPEEWLVEAEAAYDRVESYTAFFHKQQRIAGELRDEENIFLKFRKKPYSLYMKWVTEPYKGSELLYVVGWNKGRVKAHRGGFFSFIVRDLDPNAPELMRNNLRPVTSMGAGFLLQTVAINMRKAIEAGGLTFTGRGRENVYGRDTQVILIDTPYENVEDYDGARFVINQDVESKILLRIRVYDRDARLVENYGYEKMNLDARLSDADFDPKNPEYDF